MTSPRLGLITISLALASALPLFPQDRPKTPVEDAWALLATNQRPKAIRLLYGIVKTDPANADARLLLGSILQEEGDSAASIAQLTEAVKLIPNSAEAHNALGEAFKAAGDPQHARAPFEKAIALDRKFAQPHVNLGLILLDAGELNPAAAHLDRAIALLGSVPDAAYPHYLRAKVSTNLNDVPAARNHLNQAVALRPDFAEAWSDLGDALKTLRDDAGALAAFERAVALAPDDPVAQTRLGSQYFDAAQPHLAVDHLQQAARLDPTSQTTLYMLQRALRADGQNQQADAVKQSLAQLLRDKDRDDQHLLAALERNNRAVDMEKSGDLRGAAREYRAALDLLPTHVGIRANLAIALLRLGQWKDGLAELREAARRAPANAVLQAALDDALSHAPVEFGGRGQAPKVLHSGTKY